MEAAVAYVQRIISDSASNEKDYRIPLKKTTPVMTASIRVEDRIRKVPYLA
jgi:hypothetical protein